MCGLEKRNRRRPCVRKHWLCYRALGRTCVMSVQQNNYGNQILFPFACSDGRLKTNIWPTQVVAIAAVEVVECD